ncbi:anaphase-promoting complex subunit 5 [Onthophagus taurus]|uniref:anaphase-promoting complex subunit 5 n=1 Tax=Onthophagus taurus TaxID=166361 RepID=UPI000C20D28D|nr:anaphase-promoting complex subunit 5 [Onthophagus taurus]
MNAFKDISIIKKRSRRENITPHRLSVAMLVYEFSKFRESTDFFSMEEPLRRSLLRTYCIVIQKLVQGPDISLDDFLNTLRNVDHIANKRIVDMVVSNINCMINIGMRWLLDVLDNMGRLPPFEDVNIQGIITHIRNSILGYFLRTFIIYFDQLSFSEASLILDMYIAYVNKSSLSQNRKPIIEKIIALGNDWYNNKNQWSRRQADLFISTQAGLLAHDQTRALNPVELHKQLRSLLETNPDISEAYFLSYLNCLRIKEFSGALDSLHLCFDKTISTNGKSNEEKNKSFRYAVLNLAILKFHFNHKKEALAALKECIRSAQEANDNVCLQYALSWLCSVSQSNKDKLIEHSILKSLEINLSYIMSLGILSFGQFGGITCGNPKQIFETITRSDVLNCQYGHRDLISHSFSQKSALWQFYGKVNMSSLWSQLLLNFSTTDNSLTRNHYDEGFCEALCNVANSVYLESNYDSANAIFSFTKQRFPNEPSSHNWMLSENIFQFTYLLYKQNYIEAEIIAEKIACINKWDACLRIAELLIHQEDYSRAHYCVNKVLVICQEFKRVVRMDIQVRAMILLIEIQSAISFPSSVPYGILTLLNSTLAYCKDYYLDYYTSLVQVHIANVQLLLGMPGEALNVLSHCVPQILSHGNVYNRAQALMVYVKCVVAESYCKSEMERNAIILRAAKMLNGVNRDFQKLEVYYGVKDVLYLQACLYNEIYEFNERNNCALKYKILDEDCPKTNYMTLVTFM